MSYNKVYYEKELYTDVFENILDSKTIHNIWKVLKLYFAYFQEVIIPIKSFIYNYDELLRFSHFLFQNVIEINCFHKFLT